MDLPFAKRKIIIFIIVISAVAAAIFLKFSVYENKIAKVKIKNSAFKAEIAADDLKREKGLGGKRSLCQDCSMLFVFPKRDRWGFWMKDMNFNLDIVWIDGNKIIKIAKDVDKNSKDTLRPDSPADKVLELNSGVTEENGIETGDLIEIDN
jgi:uncharacterized protein